MIPATSTIGADDAPHTAWFLHGILGSGNNWRSFARKLVSDRPDWRCVLIDLRNHGQSSGAPGPHTLKTAADDLWELDGPPELLIGHSFGGKVALTYAAAARQLGVAGEGGLRSVWVLDAQPGAWEGDPWADAEVVTVMNALAEIPLPLDSREDVVTHLRQAGLSLGLARWMTTNLRRTDQGYVWKFDLDATREMIGDYFSTDLWPVLEDPGELQIDVVRAERSDRWTDAELARFAALSPESPGSTSGQVHLHLLPDSGHWVHVDNPDGLARLLAEALDGRRD